MKSRLYHLLEDKSIIVALLGPFLPREVTSNALALARPDGRVCLFGHRRRSFHCRLSFACAFPFLVRRNFLEHNRLLEASDGSLDTVDIYSSFEINKHHSLSFFVPQKVICPDITLIDSLLSHFFSGPYNVLMTGNLFGFVKRLSSP